MRDSGDGRAVSWHEQRTAWLGRIAAAAALAPFAAIVAHGDYEAISSWVAYAWILLSVASFFAVERRALASWIAAVPAFSYILALSSLRVALDAPEWLFGSLLIFPFFWLSLFGSRRQLTAALFFAVGLLVGTCFLIGEEPVSAPDVVMILVWPLVFAGVQDLVIQVRSQSAQLESLSLTDPLTGVGNRRSLDVHLLREVARAERAVSSLSVVVIDLDHFKLVNDRSGHEVGDRLLTEAAQAWATLVRAGDLLARYGGEEFVLILPDCPSAKAMEIADRCRAAMPMGQTCSAGVATWNGTEHAATLLARADAALYKAKALGRDRTVVHDGVRSTSTIRVDTESSPIAAAW